MQLTEFEQVVHKGGTNRAGVSPLEARERLLGSKGLCLYVTRVPIFKARQTFFSTSALASRRISTTAFVFFPFPSYNRPFFLTMDTSPSKGSGIELHGVRSTDREDDLALAKLGKKAVLKVRVTAADKEMDLADHQLPETIWLSFHPWLQLHCLDYLGRIFGVSFHPLHAMTEFPTNSTTDCFC
jgi:hypothetical protein